MKSVDDLYKDIKDIRKEIQQIKEHSPAKERKELVKALEAVLVKVIRKEDELKEIRKIWASVTIFGVLTLSFLGWLAFLILFTEPI